VTLTESEQHAPVDAVVERLNDPAVAASLVTLLDNAEFLSTLVLGLGGFVARGETIMDAVADGVQEFKAAGGGTSELPSPAELTELASQLGAAAPAVSRVLESPMVEPETIDLLGTFSKAATAGMANAEANETKVAGIRGALKALKDPDVQRGLGVLIEVSRSLGQQVARTK